MNRIALLVCVAGLTACSQESRAPAPATSAATEAHPGAAAPTPTPTPTTARGTTPPLPDGAELPRYHWRLSEAKDSSGSRIASLFVRPDAPVQLDFDEGRLAVSNTCNRISGTYTIEGTLLILREGASTRMACAEPGMMELDRQVNARLWSAKSFVLAAGAPPTLTLTNPANDTFTFVGVPTAETLYGGPGERAFLEVGAETVPCNHPLMPGTQCLSTREVFFDSAGLKTGEPGPWQPLIGGIEGFEHEPGVRNVVRVKRFRRANVPADAPSTVYVLDTVVESEVVRPGR